MERRPLSLPWSTTHWLSDHNLSGLLPPLCGENNMKHMKAFSTEPGLY